MLGRKRYAAALTCSAIVGALAVGTSAITPAQANAQRPPSKRVGPTGRTLTVTGSGDILIHPSLASQAAATGGGSPNFAPMMQQLKPRISQADYSICHVETAYSKPGHKTKFPHYYVHPNIAKGISATGFDDCSTASNFAADKGLGGVRRTISALHSAGVNHAGTQGSRRASRIVIRTVNGIRVAHLSYTDHTDSPGVKGAPWAINRQSPSQIARDAKSARRAGAEIVIVSLAMGSKDAKNTSARQRRAVRTITAGHNVDYVIGHGSHTVQPASLVNGTWVVWHGNLLASFFPNEHRMRTGVISDVTFSQTGTNRFRVSSIAVSAVQSVNGSIRALDLANASCWQASGYGGSQAMIARVERAATRAGLRVNGLCSGR